MNEFYESFVETGRRLAAENGLDWDLVYNWNGVIAKDQRWNLTALVGMVPPPTHWLSSLAPDTKAQRAVNEILAQKGTSLNTAGVITRDWQNVYKATLLNELLVKRNKPQHAVQNVGRYIKILATAAGKMPPWDLDGDIVQIAFNAALRIGESGKIGANLRMVVRIIIDGFHLADRSPLERFCVPYPTEDAQAAARRVDELRRKSNIYRTTAKLREELAQRKRSERLPPERAFWELVRIVFTDEPRTFSDAIRFAQVKLLICAGFRNGENVILPYDWERWREYMDADGNAAGQKGGISRSLMIRHFAEKQAADERPGGVVLYETAQHVLPMFTDLVLDTLRNVARITQPLRERLRRQTETGRLFPEFAADDLVLATDLYPRVAGSLWFLNEAPPEKLVARYREAYDTNLLDEIWDYQRARFDDVRADAVKKYWFRYLKEKLVTPRDSIGASFSGAVKWKHLYFRVGEVEEMIRRHMPTKLPDTAPFSLADGRKLYPYELLFLMPIRALAENRNNGLVDVNRYFSIGRASPVDLPLHLGLGEDNLFSRYGETDEDKAHKIDTHMLRHLQNAELFRLGVADTIITKRFNRRAVAQSYEYDHRSLAEDLSGIDLPPEAIDHLGPRAQEVFKMIRAGKVSGPIVDEFLHIQKAQGDDAALDYLNAEADGLHVTPYGVCLNSFTVDPCPKHLECFNGCRHLGRTEVPEEQRNLEQLRDRMVRVIAKIEAIPIRARNIGWQNQLKHAKERLVNIEKALATRLGGKPFPDGPDLYRPLNDKLGTTILDRKRGQGG